MAKYMTPEAKAFRELVMAHEGRQREIAAALNVSVSAISHRLNSELHGTWWRAYKKRRSRARKAAAQRRYRARAAERARMAYGYLDRQ